jgi:hypothetical protein
VQKKEHIWYASYGSNLWEERFLCYIRGGQPKGAAKSYPGCTDKTLPIDNEEIYICSEMYFAKSSCNWENGGVAFIKTDFDQQQQTLGRMYLITKGQFIDVVKQETDFKGDLTIDFDRAISDGSLVFRPDSWYGNIIFLGNQHGDPIFTFTSQDNISPTKKPIDKYLMTIIRGILETYKHLNTDEIVDYLISKQGVTDNYSRKDLKKIVENACS